MFEHERVVIARGVRSELPVIIAVHSTEAGTAVGGCRMWHYPSWQDGLADALRLSAAMTKKCAAVGLPHGGGKTVVALPIGLKVDEQLRRAVLHDVGDLIQSLDGTYVTGPDVGTSPADMAIIRERTGHVACLPEEQGGSGDSSPHTAAGVLAAIKATCAHVFGSPDLAGRTLAIVGLGHVGAELARMLRQDGAHLSVADIDPSRRELAARLGATWLTPEAALTAPVDVLVPAAVGGVLTAGLVPRLRCGAIVGPANNQLAAEGVADLLRDKGIYWVPDHIASAGGVAYAVTLELDGADHATAMAAVQRIGDTVAGYMEGRPLSRVRAD
jgi:glutamate dehydrogenase/leucine dehydrogenase